MTITLQGKFVWFELVTRDAKKAQTFYGEVFGWKVSPFAMGPGDPYEMIAVGETTIGGYTAPEDKSPARWTSYLSVSDLDAALERVKKAGGTVVGPPLDVPTIGRMVEIADPTGARLHLYRGANGDQETEPLAGTFCWNELVTQDPGKALAFYEKVAGYGHTDKDMGPAGTYHVLTQGSAMRAGIMKAPDPGLPSTWLPYVQVDGADATTARVTRNGGKVLMAPFDIENIGRAAVFSDPQGATFAILQPAPAAGK